MKGLGNADGSEKCRAFGEGSVRVLFSTRLSRVFTAYRHLRLIHKLLKMSKSMIMFETKPSEKLSRNYVNSGNAKKKRIYYLF